MANSQSVATAASMSCGTPWARSAAQALAASSGVRLSPVVVARRVAEVPAEADGAVKARDRARATAQPTAP
eukprot:7467085-Lingulodinium_polyedra.AAC.1